MSKKVRTRFAPSPTGYMHIGNLRTALYAYLFAKKEGGSFVLRIEDTDRARYVGDAVDFIKKTLNRARIKWDEGPDVGGDFAPYVQSERLEIYKKYAEELVEKGFAYRCFCEAGEKTDGEYGGYNRACRDLDADEIRRRLEAGDKYVIRQKMPLEGETVYFDVLHGRIAIPNSELEDQVLLKRDGMPTYNFANVVDDHLMEITHVIRGEEFITSTPKHVLLYEFFGWEKPEFIHLAPVLGKDADGKTAKLSKRHGATSFDDLVKLGYLPAAITNYVALLGWSPKNTNEEIFSMEELVERFSLDGLSKSPAVFDYGKLGWMNGEYLKRMDDDAFAEISRPYAGELPPNVAAKWKNVAALLKTRTAFLAEIPQEIDFLIKMPPFDAELYANKRNKTTPDKAKEILPPVVALLEAVPDDEWTNEKLYEKISAHIEAANLKKGAALWPIRIAVAGKSVTPGGATEILYILGKEESLARMKKSLANLSAL